MLAKKINIGRTFIHGMLLLFVALCIVPVILVISISLSTETDLLRYGYSIIPKTISTQAYNVIFSKPQQLLSSYTVTITVSIAGTALSVLLTSMLAYVISRKDYVHSVKISYFVFFPMLLSGGLVPWYIWVVQGLHLKNSILVLILPYLIIPWNVLLMKGFFSDFPVSIIESARIDGANEYTIFFRIVIPINKAAVATVGLFIMLMYWNDYWLSLLYIENNNLISLQFLLYRIMSNIDFLNSALARQGGAAVSNITLPNLSARMAMCVLAAGPMLVIFPFFQKYFVKGLVVGAVKG